MIKITKGEILTLSCTFKKNAQEEALDSWTIDAAVLKMPNANTTLQECAVTKANGSPDFTVTIDTNTLPVGLLALAIRLANGVSGPRSTINEPITIVEDQAWV